MREPALVELTGGLDLSTVTYWEAEVARTARSSGTLVLDLAGVDFVDSAGVHSIFRMLAMLDAQGKRLVVVAPLGGGVRRLLEILGFVSLAWVCENQEEALRDVA